MRAELLAHQGPRTQGSAAAAVAVAVAGSDMLAAQQAREAQGPQAERMPGLSALTARREPAVGLAAAAVVVVDPATVPALHLAGTAARAAPAVRDR